jgi:hypothetical protein
MFRPFAAVPFAACFALSLPSAAFAQQTLSSTAATTFRDGVAGSATISQGMLMISSNGAPGTGTSAITTVASATNTNTIGNAIFLDGSQAPFTLSRNLSLSGAGQAIGAAEIRVKWHFPRVRAGFAPPAHAPPAFARNFLGIGRSAEAGLGARS